MSLRDRLLRVLRVPPPPAPPGDELDTRTFRAAPSWLSYRRLSWLLKQGTALIGLIAGVLFLRGVPDGMSDNVQVGPFTGGHLETIFVLLEIAAWAGFVVQAITSFLLLRLDWEQRFYIVSDRSLRVREGLVRVHEKTTTFANIQQVSIRQGPLQRAFGIADVEVRSAGGGESTGKHETGDDLHTVWFRGVADAASIRDTILRRARSAQEIDPERVEETVLDRLAAATGALRAAARALPHSS